MRKIAILLLAMLAVCTGDAYGQRRKKVVKKPKPEVIEETPQEKLFKSMVGNTAKVMFIDSLIVDRSDFLSHIPLSAEAGMMIAYNELFDKQGQDSSVVYANEFGTTCYYSEAQNDSTRHLYTIDKLGKSWSQPRQLKELGSGMEMANYPFLMTDGVTLYFSAKGEESLGGYDIFMTRYDAEGTRFYTPENYGLPFNSAANEYFLAIDDYAQLGYLVSDRYQPEGKVCIYIFEPTKSRNSFEADDISDEQLNSFARLEHIKDTWKFGNRAEVLARYRNQSTQQRQAVKEEDVAFVVNDATTYHALSDFKSPEARQLFSEYLAAKSSLQKTEDALEKQRQSFNSLPISQRQSQRAKILQTERNIRQTHIGLNNMAKRIRQLENKQQ
ncbi:MAG: hypothetical protein IJ196_00185 [Prevotella sp.]|nr:hypothetical protein [Prevotella sp.]